MYFHFHYVYQIRPQTNKIKIKINNTENFLFSMICNLFIYLFAIEEWDQNTALSSPHLFTLPLRHYDVSHLNQENFGCEEVMQVSIFYAKLRILQIPSRDSRQINPISYFRNWNYYSIWGECLWIFCNIHVACSLDRHNIVLSTHYTFKIAEKASAVEIKLWWTLKQWKLYALCADGIL